MNKLMLAVSTVVVLDAGTGIASAADPMAEKEVKPTLGSASLKRSSKAP